MSGSHKRPAERVTGQGAPGESQWGDTTVLRSEHKEKKPSQTERLAALSLEGWGWGALASLGGGGKALGSDSSDSGLDLNVKTSCQKLSVTGSSLESNEQLNCCISFKGIGIILGRGKGIHGQE